jgi:hypothetical protein
VDGPAWGGADPNGAWDLVPEDEARRSDQGQSRRVLDPGLHMVWTHDLPVCFPGRQCVDFVPAGADLVYLTFGLTPLSPAIAAGCFALLGAALVLVGLGLRSQWRGPGVRPWLVVTVTALLLIGFGITTFVDLWFGSISSVYSGVYGQPRAPAPSSLAGSWHSVLAAGHAMEILAAVAIAVLATVAAVRRRRNVER